MVEADFQVKFTRWAKYNIKTSCAFELKIAKEKSLPFSAIQPHQIEALSIAKHSTLIHKISDGGYQQTPFDCFTLSGSEAYVVIMFYKRGQKEFYMIDIDVFISEMNTSIRKSITAERAKQIGTTCFLA